MAFGRTGGYLPVKTSNGTVFNQEDLLNAKHGRTSHGTMLVRRIYLITNTINTRKYVGQTSQLLRERWNNHLAAMRYGKKSPLYDDMRDHGAHNFIISELDVIHGSVKDAEILEYKYISDMQTHVDLGGYNLTTGKGSKGRRKKPPSIGKQLTDDDPRLFFQRFTYLGVAQECEIGQVDVERMVKAQVVIPYITPKGRVFFTSEHIKQIKGLLEGTTK